MCLDILAEQINRTSVYNVTRNYKWLSKNIESLKAKK